MTLRRLGGDFFVGDSGSSTTLSGGLKICEGSIIDGSTESPVRVRRAAAVRRRGVVAVVHIVFRLGDDRTGAGVNSSSSPCCWLATLFSTSELPSSSTTTLRRAAARLEGRSGDAADIVGSYAPSRAAVEVRISPSLAKVRFVDVKSTSRAARASGSSRSHVSGASVRGFRIAPVDH